MPEETSKSPVTTPEVTPTNAPAPNTPGVTNGLAIASLITGIVAFISGWIPFWGLLVGTAAVVLGIIGLKKPGGKGMSIAGIITGALGALWSLLISVFFIFAIVAGVSNTSNLEEYSNDLQEEQSEQQELINSKKDFAKGETAQFENLEVKVNSVQRDYVPDSSFYAADEGKELILVNLTIKNTGTSPEYVSEYIFDINDSGVSDSSSNRGQAEKLKGSTVEPGASVTGNTVYEVTKGASDLKLQYETSMYADGEVKELVYTLAI